MPVFKLCLHKEAGDTRSRQQFGKLQIAFAIIVVLLVHPT